MADFMDGTPDVLAKIAAYKADEVAALKLRTSASGLAAKAAGMPASKGFRDALEAVSGPAIIAEIKKASPSRGIICENFDPANIARACVRGGATCLSVLTDAPGFLGSVEIFEQVRAAATLPLLRKDFMIDPIQIVESRAMGADCILIILAMVDDGLAKHLYETATKLGMDALVEAHDADELERALVLGGQLIGVNNRDLRTFETTLDAFTPLAAKVPAGVTLVAESGIVTRNDIDRLAKEGARAFLIGESLMRQKDIEEALRKIV